MDSLTPTATSTSNEQTGDTIMTKSNTNKQKREPKLGETSPSFPPPKHTSLLHLTRHKKQITQPKRLGKAQLQKKQRNQLLVLKSQLTPIVQVKQLKSMDKI